MCDCKGPNEVNNPYVPRYKTLADMLDAGAFATKQGNTAVPAPVKDRALMFECLEYADIITVAGTPAEVLEFAKEIYEWVK